MVGVIVKMNIKILEEGRNTKKPKIEQGTFSGILPVICYILPSDEEQDEG
jgi:hypothetical protein